MSACTACRGKGAVDGMSVAPKLCPRCQTPVLTSLREAKDRKRYLKMVFERSVSRELAHTLLIVMAMNVSSDGLVKLPGKRLAWLCRCTRRSVQLNLRTLVRSGEIEQVEAGNGRGHAACYRLLLPGTEQ